MTAKLIKIITHALALPGDFSYSTERIKTRVGVRRSSRGEYVQVNDENLKTADRLFFIILIQRIFLSQFKTVSSYSYFNVSDVSIYPSIRFSHH